MFRNLRRLLKKCFYFFVFHTRLLKFAIFLLKHVRTDHPALILFYHRFHQDENGNALLPSHEIEEFKNQVLHLKKFYTFISMDALADQLKKKTNFRTPAIALTIDDGYLSSHTLAYPILNKYHIPCMIYLTVGAIESGAGLWVDDIEYMLLKTRVANLSFPELLGAEAIDISLHQGKKLVLKKLFVKMLHLNNSQREKYLNALAEILAVDFTAMSGRERLMLNWEEIREMSNNGVAFGAHTITHPFLPAMPLGDAKNEIKRSKDIIEDKLVKPVRHFAVPHGTKKDFTPALKEYCTEIGFDTLVMTEAGVVNPDADRHALCRNIPPPPLYYFACEIARYFFFSKSIK
jgi:peptidoglycan/xylan/chitin deacetylase (PgdA/CDA1 family)